MPERAETSLFEDAIDIPAWLEADGSTPLADRIRRDRTIGRQLGGGAGARTDPSPAGACKRIREWWQRIERPREALPGQGLQLARRWIDLALVFIGLVAGIGLALAAFHYDGSYPVNVVRLLALLVAPQLLLLALNLFLIPGRLPGLRFIQDALSALNPGALAGTIYRQLSGRHQSAGFSWTAAPAWTMRRFGKWQMLSWSQIAAVAFNLGVIATAAVLIAFTDLAFGWSTTLGVSTDTATRIVDAIATPWAGLYPAAVPDPALIERSQFFRLEGQGALPDSRELAGWWSFSVLAVITYGLLPRIAFLIFSAWRLRLATRQLLIADARVAALLERMSAPELETRAHAPDSSRSPSPPPATDSAATESGGKRIELAGSASAVIWNACVDADAARRHIRAHADLDVSRVLDAGGGTLAAEKQVLKPLADSTDPVLVLTAAWEPPLHEFIDFLQTLRRIVGPARAILVLPLAEPGERMTAIEGDNWRRAVSQARDPNTRIDTGDA